MITLVFDIAVLAVLALMTYGGWRRGLLRTAVSLVSSLISIAIAFLLVRPLTGLLGAWGVFGSTITKISEAIYQTGKTSAAAIAPVLEKLGMPESWTRKILQAPAGNDAALVDQTAHTVWRLASAALALIIIYVVVRVVLGLLARLLTPAIEGVPVLDWLNHTGGLVLGLVWGVCVLLIVIMALVSLSAAVPVIRGWIDGSRIVAFLAEKDIFRSLLDTIF